MKGTSTEVNAIALAFCHAYMSREILPLRYFSLPLMFIFSTLMSAAADTITLMLHILPCHMLYTCHYYYAIRHCYAVFAIDMLSAVIERCCFDFHRYAAAIISLRFATDIAAAAIMADTRASHAVDAMILLFSAACRRC